MKRIPFHVVSAVFVWLMLITASIVFGQTIITHTTALPTSEGIVSAVGARTITLRSEASPTAVSYDYNEKTKYVDETGTALSITAMKPGSLIMLYYAKVGERLVASKIIARNPAPAVPPPAEREVKKTNTGNDRGS